MSTQLNHDVKGGSMAIRTRVALFVAVPLIIILAISALGYFILNNTGLSLKQLSADTKKIAVISETITSLDNNVIDALYDKQLTDMDNSDALDTVAEGIDTFNAKWSSFLQASVLTQTSTVDMLKENKAALDLGLAGLQEALGQNQSKISDIDSLTYQVRELTEPLKSNLEQEINKSIQQSNSTYASTIENIDISAYVIGAAVILGLVLTLIAAMAFNNSISRPIKHLTAVIDELSKGNTEARSRLTGNDELTRLGKTFNAMMNDRENLQSRVDKDNEAINHSVFSLLDAVSDLSERDLTVRARVTEDATGPLADAINQLAEDTTEVLEEVKLIAMSVEQTSASVNERSQEVNKLAITEQKEAEETAIQIESIRRRLEAIAQSAIETNNIAGETSGATQEAYQSVSRSMNSIGEIRNTVQDTGKRIKRLGERSQEISYITDIINGIAERTTVLALNANMQAMAAGEAGKGFSVIADEIQRLAETSRESTEQITQLVKNIQQETTATIATMDHTIEQVIQGAALADEATQQMQQTLDTTNKLTSSVNEIASESKQQMEMSDTLQARASQIVETTKATGQEMSLLAQLTGDMSQYAKQLVESVNVFKLKP
ncbi:methyl-accepting chemotaxis protein [Leucothrix sargassi]|nr:methyl-accepting chemotaxis protein [Leucothrix sargassi]